MRSVRLAGFGVLAIAAVGIYFIPQSGTGLDPRIPALLVVLVLVVVWHFATLRRSNEQMPIGTPEPVAPQGPESEQVVELNGSDAHASRVAAPPDAVQPTEVLPPGADVVPQGPAGDEFDLDAPPPGAAPPVTDEPVAGSADADSGDGAAERSPGGHVGCATAHDSLTEAPPAPVYADGWEKWAAELFGPSSD